MQLTTITGAAVLLAFAPAALSLGTAHVVNNCAFDVYYASVAQFVAAPMIKLPPGGFSEAYSLPNVGISIKLAQHPADAPTQFEFTWANGKINYDISNINGNPFMAYGMTLAPSMGADSSDPTCKVVECAAGENPCAAAYNYPDEVRTMVCNEAADLTMTLCSGNSGAHKARSLTEDTIVAAPVQHGHGRQHARHLPKK